MRRTENSPILLYFLLDIISFSEKAQRKSMGHSKNSPWIEKHDRHEQRSDISNVRGDMKKNGAGIGNWGQIGDEINDERQVHP
ncbi:hypothetical protein NQZ79_g5653 [Umbelopsis isabellina]|nr:hypothetical protein NQZ79_g5653 [Umbelopsis isabellina]